MAYGTLQIDAGFDLSDLGGLVLDVVESGGATFTTTISSGSYFTRIDAGAAAGDFASLVAPFGSLLDDIETDFNAQGSGTWTVSYVPADRVVRFTCSGGGVSAVSITPTTNGGLVGLTGAVSAALTHDGQRTPDYVIDGEIGYWAAWDEREIETDALVDVVAHDGTPHGLAPEGLETHIDLVVPMEPRAKVFTRAAASSAPWTWRDLFRHARNVFPLAIDDGTEVHLVRLRREGAAFKPRKIAGDYVGHYDIALATRLLGRV